MPAFHPPPRRSARLQALTNRPITMGGGAQFVSNIPMTSPDPTQHQRGGMSPKKQCGKAKAPAPTLAPAPAPAPIKITWEGKHLDMLVAWITSHPLNRHILFHDCASTSSSTTPSPSDQPLLSDDSADSDDVPPNKVLGKNKKEVCAKIAQCIFRKDCNHSGPWCICSRPIKIHQLSNQLIASVST